MRKLSICTYNMNNNISSVLQHLLYFKQGWFNISSKEMIHNVKKAQTEACQTVERFATKEVNRIIFQSTKKTREIH